MDHEAWGQGLEGWYKGSNFERCLESYRANGLKSFRVQGFVILAHPPINNEI